MSKRQPSWKTAIKRNKVSLPIREHLMDELCDPKIRRLDYGCGRGYDADRLGMFKYDPHFFPEEPAGEFDRIYCGYVLNTISKKEGNEVVKKIQSHLKKGGIGYVAVRRDLKTEGVNQNGTFQRNVILEGCNWPVVDNSKYCLYWFFRDTKVKVK